MYACTQVSIHTCCYLVSKSYPNLLLCRGEQPTRLLCPWDFPGKNTGMVCHFFLQVLFSPQGVKPVFPTLQADSLPMSHHGSQAHIHTSPCLSTRGPKDSSRNKQLESRFVFVYQFVLAMLHNMWDLSSVPRVLSSPTRDQAPLHWKLSVLTTEPPGKSQILISNTTHQQNEPGLLGGMTIFKPGAGNMQDEPGSTYYCFNFRLYNQLLLKKRERERDPIF